MMLAHQMECTPTFTPTFTPPLFRTELSPYASCAQEDSNPQPLDP